MDCLGGSIAVARTTGPSSPSIVVVASHADEGDAREEEGARAAGGGRGRRPFHIRADIHDKPTSRGGGWNKEGTDYQPPLRGNVVVNHRGSEDGNGGGDAPRRGRLRRPFPGRSEGPGVPGGIATPRRGRRGGRDRVSPRRTPRPRRPGATPPRNFDSDNVDDEDGTAFDDGATLAPPPGMPRSVAAARPRTRRDARHIVVRGEYRRNRIERAREGPPPLVHRRWRGGASGYRTCSVTIAGY